MLNAFIPNRNIIYYVQNPGRRKHTNLLALQDTDQDTMLTFTEKCKNVNKANQKVCE